jgi:hypothetical protein
VAAGLLPTARAAQVVATLTGTLSSGTDFTGVFGFPPNTDLTGQAFTLTFIFDDTKGTQQVTNCSPGVPQSTEILGDSAAEGASPGTAVLQIGGRSWTFGTPPNVNLNSFASRSVPCGNNTSSRVAFSVSDVPPSDYVGDNVSVNITTPLGSPPLTTNASWEAPFSALLLPINSFADGNSFDIDQDGYINSPFLTPINFARGVFVPTSITVSGPDSPCSTTWPITPYTHSILGRPYMLASFTPPKGLTLPNFAVLCGFNHFNWQQQITTDPGGGAGTTVQPVLPKPLISSRNVIYQSSANSQPIRVTSASGLCVSSWIGCSLVAPPPYFDPPYGGYVGFWNPFPFYFPDQPGGLTAPSCASGEVCPYPYPDVVNGSNTTFTFHDGPGRTSFQGVPRATNPPAGQFLAFKTTFVGVDVSGNIYPLFSWTWNTTFNGPQNFTLIKGTGGITITSINGVQLPTVIPDEQVATAASGLAFSRVTQTFNGTVTLTNISNAPLNGPFQLLLTGLPADVTLANATGNLSGTPYLTVPNLGTLAPNQSITVGVQFKNPSNAVINLTPAIYSGSIN